VSSSNLGQLLKGNVACSSWIDAALALEIGTRLTDHWRLGRAIADRLYLKGIDAAHRTVARVEHQNLIQMAFDGIDELQITPEDTDRSFVMIPFQAVVSLKDALAFRQLKEHLVIRTASGDLFSLQVLQQRFKASQARELQVDEKPWLEFRLYPLAPDGWVSGKKQEGMPATWEALAKTLEAMLPEGLETPVVAVKMLLPDAKRTALGMEKKVVSFR